MRTGRAVGVVAGLVIFAVLGGLLTAGTTLIVNPALHWYWYFALTVVLSLLCMAGVVMQVIHLGSLAGYARASAILSLPLLLVPSAGTSLISANPWKFWLAWSVFVIALTVFRRRPWFEIGALAALAAICFVNDLRSGGATAVVIAALCLLRRVRLIHRAIRGIRGLSGRVALALSLSIASVVAGLGLASLFVQLALSGALGPAIAAKQAAQSNGSDGVLALVVGARAEAPVTVHLFDQQPWGFGLGIIGDPSTIYNAQLVYRGAVENNVTLSQTSPLGIVSGDGTQLHSIGADVWYSFGLAGVAVLIVAAIAVCVAGARLFSSPDRDGFALIAFFAVSVLFDIAFSPLRGNWYQSGVEIGAVICALSALAQTSEKRIRKDGSWG